MVAEAVVSGAVVLEAEEAPDKAEPHFSDSSPIAAMANLCSPITLAAFATPLLASRNTLEHELGIAEEVDVLHISASKLQWSGIDHI